MQQSLAKAIENVIVESTGLPALTVGKQTVHGGCINATEIIQLSDNRKFFVKTNLNSGRIAADLFEREAGSLAALAAVETIKVPSVIGYGATEAVQFLVLEAIETGTRTTGFFELFGRQLAGLHRASSARFGFDNDNYLGSTRQPNGWMERWVDFWRERRLGYQIQLARQNGYADTQFDRWSERLLTRLGEVLDTEESPALLHGDLWSGNFMRGGAGEPVLIDPAVYYGHREAEFGMTTLFGGFSPEFYASYHEAWPLPAGSEQRIEIYRLYHVLNHLNLFGASYRRQCVEIMKKYG